MRNRWFRQILLRRIFVAVLLVLQAVVLVVFIRDTSQLSRWADLALRIVSLLAVLWIVSSRDQPSYKLLWSMLILAFPIFGGLLYLLVSFQASTRWVSRRLRDLELESRPLLAETGSYRQDPRQLAPDQAPQIAYLQRAGFPVCSRTDCDYFSSGEAVFACLLKELEKAEQYIFLEFFIIQEGVMWDAIHDILRRKAAQGVTVRVLYDDMGSFLTLPRDYADTLRAEGIQCHVFNKFRPLLSAIQNNRDHRKIVSIDGRTAFTGGFNLADEYINAVEKHGHWKDTGLVLRGDAAWSLTVMFLQMWSLSARTREDFALYRPAQSALPAGDGLVQPYADSPVDRENVGEQVYLQIIRNAKQYVYIHTPYLIVGDNMIDALCHAAKSGVDVRITTPHHWDKWVVHMTTRAFYRQLLEAGVKIYEYTPGFLHAKTFVADDTVATVGTINLDYRSLYLHFECGVWLYRSRVVGQVKQDYLQTLEACQPVRPDQLSAGPLFRVFQELLRLLAPLF
ncbi:MAG TPA: cardiolipin synthase [Candidatus Gemmiger faecigallinarum]|nr:cardiolipin synthase [Candidatus Gemmiger faecigallinarum]